MAYGNPSVWLETTGNTHHNPIQLLPHHNLAPQSTRLRQPKCQIQHVILIVARLLHPIKHLVAFYDDVAGTAGAAAAARAFHFEVVGLRYVEEVVAVGHYEGVVLEVFVDEGDVAFFAGLWGGEVAVGAGGCGCEGAGFGGISAWKGVLEVSEWGSSGSGLGLVEVSALVGELVVDSWGGCSACGAREGACRERARGRGYTLSLDHFLPAIRVGIGESERLLKGTEEEISLMC